MHKQFSWIFLLSFLLFLLSGCGGTSSMDSSKNTPITPSDETYDIALITDGAGITDGSFFQAAWDGITAYSAEYGVSSQHYDPNMETEDAYLEAISQATANGAKLIICPGIQQSDAVYQAQNRYPDVCFVTIDYVPTSTETQESLANGNTYSILFAEEESGFLAGYSAVRDGYTKLGFLGGKAYPAVVRYGTGFLQGIDTAAQEMGIDVEVMYHYSGVFEGNEDVQALAHSWYSQGTEVIFSCGGSIYTSVCTAAEAASTAVIGVDTDQSAYSDTIITSATKDVASAVYQAIELYYNGTFPGGTTAIKTAKEDMTGLAMENSRFLTFDQLQYEEALQKLLDGTYTVLKYEDGTVDLATIVSKAVRITYVN